MNTHIAYTPTCSLYNTKANDGIYGFFKQLHKVTAVQECDATAAAQSYPAGYQKIFCFSLRSLIILVVEKAAKLYIGDGRNDEGKLLDRDVAGV